MASDRHICRQDDVVRARLTNESIYAMCGKQWKPAGFDEESRLCEACAGRAGEGWTIGTDGRPERPR